MDSHHQTGQRPALKDHWVGENHGSAASDEAAQSSHAAQGWANRNGPLQRLGDGAMKLLGPLWAWLTTPELHD
jgi:hypothetical protein